MASEIIQSPDEKLRTIKDYLDQHAQALGAVIPKVIARTLTPDRLIRIVTAAVSRQPALLNCTVESLYAAVHGAAQLGLELGSPLGHAYPVPFNNSSTRKMEVQLIVGYRGLIAIARRSRQIASIEAHVVRQEDEFEFELGLTPKLRHVPNLTLDTIGKPKLAYMIAHLVGGGVQVEVMTRAEIIRIKGRSRAASKGPWVTDEDEMWRKTVVRRGWKYLPIALDEIGGPEVSAALEEYESATEVVPVSVTGVETNPADEPTAAPDFAAVPPAVAAAMAGKKAAAAPQPPANAPPNRPGEAAQGMPAQTPPAARPKRGPGRPAGSKSRPKGAAAPPNRPGETAQGMPAQTGPPAETDVARDLVGEPRPKCVGAGVLSKFALVVDSYPDGPRRLRELLDERGAHRVAALQPEPALAILNVLRDEADKFDRSLAEDGDPDAAAALDEFGLGADGREPGAEG